MTELRELRALRPARRRSRGRRVAKGAAYLVAAAVLVAAGVAIGESLHDNPQPGGTRTIVRQLRPLPLPPVRETVTVTRPARAREP